MPCTHDPAAPPAHLVAAAQAAMAAMVHELEPQLRQELQRISAARTDWRSQAGTVELRIAAHDLRGLGATYGVPLAGRIATSLERLLGSSAPPAALVEAHVDAIMAMVREGAAGAADPRGLALADALEAAAGRLEGGPLRQAA